MITKYADETDDEYQLRRAGWHIDQAKREIAQVRRETGKALIFKHLNHASDRIATTYNETALPRKQEETAR